MPSKSHDRLSFQLEMLESRMLLAGDLGAITSTGSFLTNFDPAVITTQVTIASVEGGALSIDASLLPDTVRELRISGFSSVTINGSDEFQKLDLSYIGAFTGDQINVNGELKVRDVASLKLNSMAGFAWLNGREMRLEVFDARSMTILSALESLTISTQNGISLLGKPEIGEQEVRLEFRLDDDALQAIRNVIKNVIYPNAEPDPTAPIPGVGNPTDSQSSYLVIIIISNSSSPGVNFSLITLQDALARGNADSIKHAFADYLKGIQASNAHPMDETSWPTANEAAKVIQQFGENSRNNRFETGLLDESAWAASDHYSSAAELHLVDLTSAGIQAQRLAASPNIIASEATPGPEIDASPSLESSAIKAARDRAEAPSDQFNRGAVHLVSEGVRATLAGLVSEVSANIQTVSAYIIDEVGNRLESGVLPGLLVDAKSSRSRRDAVEWIQV